MRYLLTLTALLCAFPIFSNAQFDLMARSNHNLSMRNYKVDPYKNRFNEVGITTYFSVPTCDIAYFYQDKFGNYQTRSSVSKIQPIIGYGLTVGSGIHLTELSDKSALALNIHLMFNYAKANIKSGNFKINNKDVSFSEEVTFYQILVPFSLDYKVGAEAVSDVDLKSMYGFGVGFAPKDITSDFWQSEDFSPKILPFVKFEAGYILGWAFKLRAMYFFGEQVLGKSHVAYNFDVDNPQYLNQYIVSNSGEFVVSLIVMPYTKHWY